MPTDDFIAQPAPDTVIWRYMDYVKFVSLIHRSSLFFCQARRFDDTYEGSMKLLDMGAIEGTPLEHALKQLYNAPNGPRSYIAVNCWHMNDHEAVDMWERYTRNQGIAIRSTVDKLNQGFVDITTLGHVRRGALTYAKVENVPQGQDYGVEVAFFRKRPQYKNESEYRVIILARDLSAINRDGGMFVQVNLPILAEAIYIAPGEPVWKRELIEDFLRSKHNLNIPVLSSALSDTTDY